MTNHLNQHRTDCSIFKYFKAVSHSRWKGTAHIGTRVKGTGVYERPQSLRLNANDS